MKIKVIFIEIGKSEGGTLRGKKIKAKPDELIFKQTRFEMATNHTIRNIDCVVLQRNHGRFLE